MATNIEIGPGITFGGGIVIGAGVPETAQYILTENNNFLLTENGLDLLITEES